MNRQLNLNVIFILISLMMLGFRNQALALSTDQQQTFKIIADSVQIDHETGTNVYHNHVHVGQGTTHLAADLMITHSDIQNQMQEIIATGRQAIYRTLANLQKPELIAVADTIKYYPKQNKVLLLGNAKVTQGQNVFTGPIIEYNTKLQTVISQAKQLGRTTVVIHPSNAKQS